MPLARLPVPDLEETLARFEHAVSAIADPAELVTARAEIARFRSGPAAELQGVLELFAQRHVKLRVAQGEDFESRQRRIRGFDNRCHRHVRRRPLAPPLRPPPARPKLACQYTRRPSSRGTPDQPAPPWPGSRFL